MRHDGVQDCFLLSSVEVQIAPGHHHVFAKPPGQQVAGGGRDKFQDV